MLKIPEYLKRQQSYLEVMELKNFEEQVVTRQFQETGKDYRITLKNSVDGELFQKSYYLDNKGTSIDTGYFKPLLKYTYPVYAEEGYINFSALIGKLFLVGIDETFSKTTLQTYKNISIFVPLDSDFMKQIKNI